ncbi:MAG: tRNA 2-thiocytidine(32) synthetase TtcA [Ruminococcaceae bacterium]|nr:tRNA 2-thiocytidine(32) synthetase TtcA [Oscillospiraceae bacterium]
MDHKKHILSYTRRAVDDYSMIRPGDKIAVGVSAGKDSLALLCAMAGLRRFYPIPFELMAITVDMGFGDIEANQGKILPEDPYGDIRRLCESLDVPYKVVPSEIAKIIFDVRKEQNPCSLCAKLRRGALHNAAKAEGCTSVALGHHFDDAVETFMLNLFYEGRIGCFQPVTYLSRVGLYVIRPLLYAPEKEVAAFAKEANLPVVSSSCPADENTQREEMKQLLRDLERNNKGLRHRIFGAIQRGEIDGFHLPDRRPLIFPEPDEQN